MKTRVGTVEAVGSLFVCGAAVVVLCATLIHDHRNCCPY